LKLFLIQILGKIERQIIYLLYKNRPLNHQPIFIVGAPRSGSTILYQIITSYFDLLYVNNFIAYRFQTFYLSFLRSSKRFKKFDHQTNTSNYGITEGENSPNESVYFWKQWFNFNEDNTKQRITTKQKKVIYALIAAVSSKFNKSIVFKNLDLGQNLNVIKDIFPDAIIIYVKREKIYNVQSIYLARLKFFNDPKHWFSVKPGSYEIIKHYDYTEQIVRQVADIEAYIENNVKLSDKESCMQVNYEELCKNPEGVISDLTSFLQEKGVARKHLSQGEVVQDSLRSGNHLTVSDELIDEFNKHINRLKPSSA
jgi:LPS sulfotransferase NodH